MALVKLLNEDMIHRGFQYKIGLNTDTSTYGLSFTFEHQWHRWIIIDQQVMYWYCELESIFPAIENNRCLNITIKNKRCIWDSPDLLEKLLKHNGLMLRYVKNQTVHLNRIAVYNNYHALAYDKIQDPSYIDFIFQELKRGLALQYINKQNINMIKSAVISNGYAIRYAKIITEEIAFRAVISKPRVLSEIALGFRSERVCYEAVKRNASMLFYCPVVSDRMIWTTKKQVGTSNVVEYMKFNTMADIREAWGLGYKYDGRYS